MWKTLSLYLIILFSVFSCKAQEEPTRIVTGAEQIHLYFELISGKNVGLCVNHTSLVENTHLVDTLSSLGVNIHSVFTPEHGFRGKADAGELVENEKSKNFKLVSLYGKNKKPSSESLQGIDVMVFDIQDVGARFYTYISTMHYVMEACAENNIPLIILDRPNPHGSYVDGPVLQPAFKSFVGMHPIPVVHGLTVGELAKMINGEGWLANGVKCDLKIIYMKNWNHSLSYSLPVKPSPNLPNDQAISLYPSLCFFEGTTVSVGRGTELPFQIIGHPEYENGDFSFTPVSGPGAKYPKHENKVCIGMDLRSAEIVDKLDLQYLITFYKKLSPKTNFFNDYFDTLAGTDQLRLAIEGGKTEEEIRQSWVKELNEYKQMRIRYLLYE